jgi:hypothetical protein
MGTLRSDRFKDRAFSQSLPANDGIVDKQQIKSHPPCSTVPLILYSLIILPFADIVLATKSVVK